MENYNRRQTRNRSLRASAVLLLTLLLTLEASAQAPDSNLVSRYRPGFMWFYSGLRPSTLVDARKYDRLMFDVLYNSWNGGSQQAFQQHGSSIGWNVQLFFDIPLTARNTVALGIGLGYGHTRIRYDQTLQRIDSTRSTTLADFPSNASIDKSVFRSNKLFIPFELRFRTPGWQHAKLHVGGRAGWQFRTSSSLYTKFDGQKIEDKTIGFYDLNPFFLSAHARFGVRNWAVTASYNITPYFKSRNSSKLNGLEVGLSISLF